jgi:2-isopropylmalate synthase
MDEDLVRNYIVEKELVRIPQKLMFWDETLRDGEQTPGVFFTSEEKVRIARLLDEIGVGMMDVGIPVVSKKEFESVKAVAKEGLKARIMGAARTVRKDIDACIDSDVGDISIFVACSDLHLKYKLKMTKEEVLEKSVDCVQYAKDHGLVVSFVTEDTVRADIDYVEKLYNATIDAGAVIAVLCDTVGVMVPQGMKWFISEIKKRFKPVQLSIHCHNDFGLGVANTLAAVEEGVEIPHTTVNGIGERAGNASFEETAMALESLYKYDTGLKIQKIFELSNIVEELTGMPRAANRPIIGYNAFSHESGIHTHGVLMHQLTYEPMMPETVGRTRRFIFGKHTGSAAVIDRLKNKGIEASPEKVLAVVERIKSAAERRTKEDDVQFIKEFRERELGKGIGEEEFWSIVKDVGIDIEKKV